MVDQSKERKHQLAFKLKNVCIFEKLSKIILGELGFCNVGC